MTPPPAAAPAVRTRPLAPPVRAPRAPRAPVRRPRRISGPAPASVGVPARPRSAASPTTAASPAVVRRGSQLLDRLIHGRAWIALVAFALIGIVTAQLGLLKLNAGIGRALEHVASLQRENAELSVEDSSAAAGDAIQLQAAHMGMEVVPAGALRFLSARHAAGGAARAAAALNAASAHAAEVAAASAGVEARSGNSETSGETSTEAASEATASSTEATTSSTGSVETEAEGAQG